MLRELPRWRQHRMFLIAITPVVIVTAILLALPFSPAIQLRIMERFHLASDHFVGWAALQPVPSMYNFANEVWISDFPMSQENLRKYPNLSRSAWCNHFPMQYMTARQRDQAPAAPYREFLHLCTSYGEQRLFSRVELQKTTQTGNVQFRYEPIEPPVETVAQSTAREDLR